MINEKLIKRIHSCGTFLNSGEQRRDCLEGLGFRMDENSEYILLGGCQLPERMPSVFSAMKRCLDQLRVDYTMLSKEYCCGWGPFGQPAVMSKDQEDIAKAKQLSEMFILKNFGSS